MTLIERIHYYAKGIAAAVGGVATFTAVVVKATADNHIDDGDITTLATAVVTLVGTVIAVIKLRNIKPSPDPEV